MKRDGKNAGERLDRSLTRYSNPTPENVQAAIDNVWENLQAEAGGTPERVVPDLHPANRASRWQKPAWIAAAAAVVLAILSTVIVQNFRSDGVLALAVVEAIDGELYRLSRGKTQALHAAERIEAGDIVRASGGAGAVLVLADGSRIEMRSQSELALEPADDGVRIRLNGGSVIVSAAKQRSGHLYVQTREVTVSVVGTVFLVNAEETGSRVAVIQGEVRVQLGTTSKKLLPGEQVATNPLMESPLVSEEISWSRNAPAHLALLQRATAEPAQSPEPAVPARPKFAVVSIKTHETQYYPNGEYGFGCRGADGASSALFGSFNISIVPRGRCFGDGVMLRSLLPFVYGPPFRLRLGAGVSRLPDDIFQLEGVAEDPSAPTVEQLMEMLRTMMADRFNLKSHTESQEVSGHALVIARDGQKLQEASGTEELPRWNGPWGIKGKSSLEKLAQFLTSAINAPVVDKTGLTGIYEYEIRWSPAAGGARGGPNPQGQIAAASPAGPGPSGSAFFANAEENAKRADGIADGLGALGLRLQGEKVPVEILVIDRVERPSAN